jgi:tetratricopeptide (TPR) repeat protein
VVLVHGLGGSGKSRLLRQFRLLADGGLPDSPVPAGRLRTVWLDWEDESRDQPAQYASMTGPGLVTVLDAVQRAVLNAFAGDSRAADRAGQAFGAYRQGAARMPEYAARFADVIAQSRQAGSPFTSQDAAALARSGASAGLLLVGHPGGIAGLTPDQLAASAQAAGHLSEAAAQAVTGKKRGEISAEEYDLVTDPARELTRRLAAALRDVIDMAPLVILLDTGEVIGGQAWAWLRRVMTLTGPRVLWVAGARFETEAEAGFDSPVAQFVREIGNDHLVLMLPTRFDDAMIGEYLHSRVGTSYSAEQVDMIARFTRGLPLAVSLTATLLEQGQPVADVCLEADGRYPGSVVSQLARRYLVHAENREYPASDPRRDDVARILGLALAYGDLRGDPELLGALWDIPGPQGLIAFQELARRHDFVLPISRRLHDDVRDTVRADLLDPYRRARVREINQRTAGMFTTRLADMRARWPSLDDQAGHNSFTAVLLSKLWHTLWTDNQDGLDLFTVVLPVLAATDAATAHAAAAIAGYFAGTFDQDQRRDLDLLTAVGSMSVESQGEQVTGTVRRVALTMGGLSLPCPDGAAANVPVGDMVDRQAAVLILRAGLHTIEHRDEEALSALRQAASQTSSRRLRLALGAQADAIARRLVWAGTDNSSVATPTGLAAAKLATEILPGSASAWLTYGAVLGNLGELEDALAAHDQAIALDPGNSRAHNNRGVALGRLGRHADALAAHDQAIALDPGNARAHISRGNALLRLGRPADALVAYDRALVLDPGNSVTCQVRGSALRLLGRPADALAAFDQALTLDNGNAGAYQGRGIALRDMGRPAEALAAYDQAIALDSGKAGAHNGRAIVLRDLGRVEDALAAYDRSIALDPGVSTVHGNKGILLTLTGRLDDALAELNSADRLSTDGAGEANVWAGSILWHRGDPAGARERFARVLDRVTGCTPLITAEMEAIALCGLGRLPEAEERLRAAVPQRVPADVAELDELYGLLSDPLLPGIDRLRAIAESGT